MNDIAKHNWLKWKETNMNFWRGKLPAVAKSFNFEFQLHDYFGPMIGEKKEVWIADLGCGVLSTTGSTWPNVKVHLYPSDIWTNEYVQMHMQAGITPFIKIEKQDMENLTYSNNLFDIVHSSNAVDHCINPLKALKEMYRVCDRGGWIYLRHTPNEGERHRYTMQHQWNICLEGTDCRIWNKQESFRLSEYFKGFKNEIIDNCIVSTLQKI